MRRPILFPVLRHGRVLLFTCLLLLVTLPVLAQSAGDFDLTWNTIDGGGGTYSTGGDFSLGGTLGQPDAGLAHGGDCTLAGGFWVGGEVTVPEMSFYLPLIRR